MIKDLVVNLAVDGGKDSTRDYAISVAAAFGAHLTGVAFAYEPLAPGSIFDGVSASIIDTQRAACRDAADEAAKSFDEAVRRAGISGDSAIVSASIEGCGEVFARIARHYDLATVGQPKPDNSWPDDMIAEATLFGAGHPILAVPYIQKGPFAVNRALLCWDGSRSAARAIADALPILARSKQVEIITIAAQDDKRPEIPGVDIAHHLARHSLKVELKRIVAPDTDVASTILSHAADSGADLIVMGGYGHSRFREFVLGGATRDIFSSMTVPVLMSH